MARKKKTLNTVVSKAVATILADIVKEAEPKIEAAVNEAVSDYLGLPTGADLIESHVSGLVTKNKSGKVRSGKRRPGRPRMTDEQKRIAAEARKKQAETVSENDDPENDQESNGAGDTSYEALQQKVSEQRGEVSDPV